MTMFLLLPIIIIIVLLLLLLRTYEAVRKTDDFRTFVLVILCVCVCVCVEYSCEVHARNIHYTIRLCFDVL